MELIDREHLLVDVASLKQSPWFNRGKNEQILHGVYLERKEAVETVEDLCIKSEPTVEAIPKADYEARLKADMVAMLTEIQLEIEELDPCGDEWSDSLDACNDIIQQKINALQESEDNNNGN